MQPIQQSPEPEHVERIEPDADSSMGWPTQHLPAYGDANTMPTPYARGRNNIIALALIAIGALMFLGRFLPNQGEIIGGLVLLTISSGFLFFAFARRLYPLLIPGCILAGLGLGVPLGDLTNGASVVWGLALGFLSILLIGRSLFNVHSPWPLFPAVPLFCVGVIIAIATLPTFLAGSVMWLPLLLIAAGLYLGWGRRAA